MRGREIVAGIFQLRHLSQILGEAERYLRVSWHVRHPRDARGMIEDRLVGIQAGYHRIGDAFGGEQVLARCDKRATCAVL